MLVVVEEANKEVALEEKEEEKAGAVTRVVLEKAELGVVVVDKARQTVVVAREDSRRQ
jgi:hypothetical protein